MYGGPVCSISSLNRILQKVLKKKLNYITPVTGAQAHTQVMNIDTNICFRNEIADNVFAINTRNRNKECVENRYQISDKRITTTTTTKTTTQ